MKILTSHRDPHFQKWNLEDWARVDDSKSLTNFNYVPVQSMQRGDKTSASQAWLGNNKEQNQKLLENLHESLPRDGMLSPLILVSVKHPHWEKEIGKTFWLSIPFVIHSGNNRYKVAVANNYTHISSIILGAQTDVRVFKFLQDELKKPLSEPLQVNKDALGLALGIPERGLVRYPEEFL